MKSSLSPEGFPPLVFFLTLRGIWSTGQLPQVDLNLWLLTEYNLLLGSLKTALAM